MRACAKSLQSCPTLYDPMQLACQAPLSMGISRQEYWSGLPFPSPGDLLDPGIERQSPTLEADTLTSEPPGKPPKGLQRTALSLLRWHLSLNSKPLLWAICSSLISPSYAWGMLLFSC